MANTSSDTLSRRRIMVETILLVLTFISTTLGGAISFVWSKTSEASLQEIEMTQKEHARLLAEQAQRLAELKETNTYTLSVHREVVEALKSQNKRLEAVAIALVESLPTDNPYRIRLLFALSQGASTPEIRERAYFQSQEAVPDASSKESLAGRPPTGKTPAWNVDVFYCEGEADSKTRAESIARALEQKPIGTSTQAGRIRVRMLPASVNVLPGYRVSGIQVRYESHEKAAGLELASSVKATLNQEASPVQISKDTPSYLSVFFCAESLPASGPVTRVEK